MFDRLWGFLYLLPRLSLTYDIYVHLYLHLYLPIYIRVHIYIYIYIYCFCIRIHLSITTNKFFRRSYHQDFT